MNTSQHEPHVHHAHLLGYSGLIPFVLLTVGLWALPVSQAASLLPWLLGYSAVILSFIGALHWGIALASNELPSGQRSAMMLWSVVPALIAWIAISLPSIAALALMAVMFVVQFIADQRITGQLQLDPWFLRLRARLSATVVLCLSLAVVALALPQS